MPASPATAGALLLLAVLALSSLSAAAPDLSSDVAALQSFRTAVGRFVLPSWNPASSPCSWQGVGCDGARAAARVTSLRLPGVGLIGQIPAATIANLTTLRTLSLRFNALSGRLPADLAALTELRNLYLHRNRFSGEIPPSLSELKSLVRLNLAGNQFSGVIPPELGNLTRLATLYLEDNRLTGEIPPLGLNLGQFNVSYNRLNGSIPQNLRSLPASAFLGTGLCGGPLGPCPGEISQPPAAGGENPSVGGGNGKSRKLSAGAIAGIAVSGVVFVVMLVVILCLLCRRIGRRKTKGLEDGAGKMPEGPVDVESREKGLGDGPAGNAAWGAAKGEAGNGVGGKKLVFFGGGPVPFVLEDLLRASAEVLGKGAFGTAYKAVLETAGVTVAVKRLKDVNLSEGEFREKVEAIGVMDHPKLVPLRAYYFSKDEKLLVYDFMPDGSLSALLHGNRGSGKTPLNWATRRDIALAAAQGIEYIHSTSPSASHGNIKSSNILLDKSEARVSDHGLALLVGPSSTPIRVAGYRAPEVTDLRKISQKADVYSFGVLLLELITGKAPAQATLNEEGVDLPRWVQSVVREEWTAEVFDVELLRSQNAEEEEMVQLLQLAIDCTAQHPDKRLAISDVVARIEEIKRTNLGATNQVQHNKPLRKEEGDGLSSRADSVGGVKPAGVER